jgi:hypothetical protein
MDIMVLDDVINDIDEITFNYVEQKVKEYFDVVQLMFPEDAFYITTESNGDYSYRIYILIYTDKPMLYQQTLKYAIAWAFDSAI